MIKTLIFSLLMVAFTTQSSTFKVDDSYTINQRFIKNHKKYPELKLPTLNFTTNTTIDFNLVYNIDNGRELKLDIFRQTTITDDSNKKATILLIHGGGWRSGSRSHMYSLANKLAQQGYTAVPIDYRLSIEAPYPNGLKDINNAIVWLKKNAKHYGINSENMMIAGGSSGGHMAALIAYSGETNLFKTPTMNTKLTGVIVLDGVLDFTSDIGLKFENSRGDQSAAALWLGGRYEAIPKRWKEASPVFYINKKSPPLLFISSGHLRFQAGLNNVKKRLNEYGTRVQYYQFDSIPHTFWLFEPWLTTTVGYINQFIIKQNLLKKPIDDNRKSEK